jgi:pectinesterase
MILPARGLFVRIALALGALACSEAPPGSDGSGNGAASGTAGVAGDAGGSAPGGSGGASSGAGGASAGTGAGGGSAGLSGLGGTPARPILTGDQAANFTILAYLAKAGPVTAPTTDDWDPTAGVGDVTTFTAGYTVAATGGTHTSVQAAITAAVTAGGTNRHFVRVMPGTYREVVCVPTGAPPITLYSTSSDPSLTTIVYDHLAGDTVDAVVNACVVPSSGTYGTGGSATFAVYGSGFQAKNLTISNDGDESTAAGAVQGVALNTRGDKLVFENVHFLANQDTLLVGSTNVDTIRRAYFKGSTIEGDVDFICGRGTAVFDGGTIRLATNRRANGNLLAPSTNSRNPYGFLIIGATFTAAAGAQAGGMTLGRAWDESQVDVPTYTANVTTGVYPNGQAVVRDSMLGPHVNGTAPWAAAATTARPFSSTPTATLPANRLYEFNDMGP